jgi:alkaline phosphatase
MKFRLLSLLVVCGLATTAWAQRELRIIPPNGATFAPGQRFDIRLEADELEDPPQQFTIEINGRDERRELFGTDEFKTYAPPPVARGARRTPGINGGVTRRNWTFERPGKYEITASLTQKDGKKLTAKSTIEVVALQPLATRAKNVILFIGDGMGPAVRTAARVVSKGLENGKYKGLLEMDQMEVTGTVMTASLDALVTDSSPGAGAWATGNKSDNNWHGVYPDNNNPQLGVTAAQALEKDIPGQAVFMDNPRVENIAEFLQRTQRMSTGVVSTVAVTDSTPGAFSSHSHRYVNSLIAEQMVSSGHSVILGGGSKYFLPPGHDALKNIPSGRPDKRNIVEEFKKAGYTFATTSTELKAAARSDKILGLFHGSDMATRYDRARALNGQNAAKEVVGKFPDQPTLEFMTQVALNVLSRNDNGFLLMVEGGSIDRELHRMDAPRAIYDAIELDKAIGVARAWASERGHEDTLILVTADHETAGLALIGVNDNGQPRGRAFPSYEDKNFDGFPDDLRPDLAVTFDFADGFNPQRNIRYMEVPRNVKELNPDSAVDPTPWPLLPGGIPILAGHSAVDVQIGARGPGASLFGGTMDNTAIFFKMLRALKEK